MFLLKKVVGPLFLPVTMILIILIAGLFFLFLTRRQRAGKILVLIGTAWLCLLSYNGISERILRPLECKYPPLLTLEGIQDVKWIAVLGGGHTSDPQLPLTSQLSGASLVRLVEGIRLHRELPQSKLILSGGAVLDPVCDAELLSEAALAMGVKKEDLILEAASRDTGEQARLIREIVGRDRFILVTSASHMLRSILFFERLGLNPIPAPTDHLVKEDRRMTPGDFYPWAGSLQKAERALYEYLGLIWAKLWGLI
ncbi:MAG: envelope biogenesis factor ElyC [Syntrophaceae bacterium]|nr:envelope biogenesis factor ElyC [Syntrophaceae bacterium]